MKTIIKTTLIVAALFFGLTMNAQDQPITFGVKVGANLSNFGGDVENNKAKFGFNGGVTIDYAITPDFYLLSGLEFTTKGAKYEYKEEGENEKGTMNAMYLQLPIHAGYKLTIAEGTKLVFHAGPYIAYGIGGKITDEDSEGKVKWDFFGSKEEGLAKRFDFGLGLGAGVEFGKINVGLGYDFGLLNISHSKEGKLRNMNAYLTVGYKF